MTTVTSCAAGNLREQILSAAASCFRERGIKATTMQEIAKRAGISVGNFYNYFDGKDAIIDEFAQREVARLAREIDEIVNGRVSLEEQQRQFCDSLRKQLEVQRVRVKIEIIEEAARNGSMGDIVKRSDAQVRELIMRVAPLGAFGAMAFTIGKYGLDSLIPLAELMGTFYLTCLLFIFVVLGLICRWHGFSILHYIMYIKEELLIVLGTSSSESVLPRMMDKMEKAGVTKSVVGLVIPTGYSFNLDGTAIYLTMAAVFIAQACDVQMTLVQQLTLLAVLLLTSKGAAGVTGSGFIVLAATLSAVGHVPVAGLALILGIDRFMSEARAITNMIGNGIACIVVGHWLKEVDNDVLKKTLGSSVSKEIEHAEDNVRDDPETIGVPADMHERAEHLDETHYGKEHPNK